MRQQYQEVLLDPDDKESAFSDTRYGDLTAYSGMT